MVRLTLAVLAGLAVAVPSAAVGQTLVGVVYDSTRAAPLEGAEVRLLESDLRALTDPRGMFSFEDLTEGPHSVTFSSSGGPVSSTSSSRG